MKGIDYWPIQ